MPVRSYANPPPPIETPFSIAVLRPPPTAASRFHWVWSILYSFQIFGDAHGKLLPFNRSLFISFWFFCPCRLFAFSHTTESHSFLLKTINAHNQRLNCLDFCEPHGYLLTGCQDSSIKLFDLAKWSHIRTLTAHTRMFHLLILLSFTLQTRYGQFNFNHI